jgi:hypothetical protein
VLPATYLETPRRFQPFLDSKIIPVDPLTTGSKVPLIVSLSKFVRYIPLQVPPTKHLNPSRHGRHPLHHSPFPDPLQITSADYTAYLNYTFGSLAANISTYYPISAFDSTAFPAFYAITTVLTDSYFKCCKTIWVVYTKTAVKSLETTGCQGPIRRCRIRHGARLPYKYAVI